MIYMRSINFCLSCTLVYMYGLTCNVELKGLCIFIMGVKLLFSGTLAPKYGLNLYGLGIPTPKTCKIHNQLVPVSI